MAETCFDQGNQRSAFVVDCHEVARMSASMALFDDCIPLRQLISCSMTRPSLCEGCDLQDYSAYRSVELPFYVVFMTSSFTTVSEQIVMYTAVTLQFAEFTSVVVKWGNIRLHNF